MRSKVAYCIILFSASVLLIFYIVYINLNVLEKRVIPMRVNVGEGVGFNVDSNNLDFGTVPFNGSSSRNFTITNNYAFPIKVEIDSRGNITEFLYFDKQFILMDGEEKNLKINTLIFSNASSGIYFGELLFTLKKFNGDSNE